MASMCPADFGPIHVRSGSMPVRFWFVAHVFARVAGLWRVRSWFESGRVTSVPGNVPGVKACVAHLCRSDTAFESVGSSCAAG